MVWDCHVKIVGKLREDVPQRSWNLHTWRDGEGKTVGIAGSRVWVLPKNDNLDLFEGGRVQGSKYLIFCREDSPMGAFLGEEVLESAPVRLRLLEASQLVPRGRHSASVTRYGRE